ncbi:MAG TPA: 2-oxoacid:ferredoxin oxidoreductase subunit gamma [Spirochaetes bacterium]|nr:2-oxoacid:ferredoxin oxidoreductase subunit gamma [Spirochaetota bacterium]
MYFDVIMAGFGGQGIQIISQIVVVASINKKLNVTYLPSYGVEKRGGRTNVTIVVSDEEIGSPVVNHPLSVIAMDTIALAKYGPQLTAGGLLIANTSLIPEDSLRLGEVTALGLRCNDEALALGSTKLANMIALGSFVQKLDFLDTGDVEAVLPEVIPDRLKDTIPANIEAIRRGAELARNAVPAV